MADTYDVLLGGEAAGKAQVSREGLYYCFQCRLHLSGEVMYKLILQKEGQSLDLGVPVPQGNLFTLTTRIPIKRIGEGPFTIRAVPKHAPVGKRFVPLKEDEPFRYLSKLNEAVFAVQDGKSGILIDQ